MLPLFYSFYFCISFTYFCPFHLFLSLISGHFPCSKFNLIFVIFWYILSPSVILSIVMNSLYAIYINNSRFFKFNPVFSPLLCSAYQIIILNTLPLISIPVNANSLLLCGWKLSTQTTFCPILLQAISGFLQCECCPLELCTIVVLIFSIFQAYNHAD